MTGLYRAAGVVVLLAAAARAALLAQGAGKEHGGIEGITAARIAHHIEVLADDSLLGRATPSRGLDAAATYVAGEFRRAGLRPPSGDDFVVRWPLVTTHAVTSGIELAAAAREVERLVYGTDFGVMRTGATRLTGRVVVVKDLSDTATIRGRIPVLRLPPGDWRGPAHAATFAARRAGAAGLVLVLDSAQAVAPVATATAEMDHASNGVPTALVSAAAAQRLVPDASATEEITLVIPVRTDTVLVPYVVGVLPGRSPRRRNEYVVISAHLDHLGVRIPADKGDSIYNGADDNASGVAAVIETAHALGRMDRRPSRSVIFFTPSAEELCICGSEYFTRRPPVPIGAIVADINLDGIGRSWQADTVSAVGSPYSTLGHAVRTVAQAHPDLTLTVVDDQWPDRQYFTTSDQIWFARRGVPSIFLSSSGPDEHYHHASDEAGTIEADFSARISRLGAWLVQAVAESPERPRWDEAARRALQIAR
jgi:Iap family predicted aminopeptidase